MSDVRSGPRFSSTLRSSIVDQFVDFAWLAHPSRVWDLVRIAHRETVDSGAIMLHVISVQHEYEGLSVVPETSTFPFDASHSVELDDLCDMNNLHEAPLLYTLEKRLQRDMIYTSASNIVISINPYRNIPGLFDNPMEFYETGKVTATDGGPMLEKPHVYGVANKVLSSLVNAGPDDIKNQSVVISGESGAGKTEASKYVMRFLIAVNDASLNTSRGGIDIGARIRDVLVDTNIVLEAFGNAKTVRNDNSSRFGKYTKLQYTEDNKLSSAFTQTFLLEKSRLTSVGAQERNYHVLYQVAKGSDASLDRESLRLTTVDDYHILTSGGCTVAGREDNDAELFFELCGALRTLRVSEPEMSGLWSLLAAILHMGNVRVNAGDETQSHIESPSMSLLDISALLGCSEEDFRRSLLYHMVKISKRSSVSMKQLTAEETTNNILALMKWLYNGVFTWLVRKLNAAYTLDGGMGSSAGTVTKFIGILDIFGFETLLNNSFEQLCINFANERLQQQFNEQVFVFEQIEYEKEGLNWSCVTFRDNQPVIDLISKKPSGLLNILEEHGMMNRKPDDSALLTSYGQMHHQKHPAYEKPRFGEETFTVKHFAGDVSYNIQGFLGKNNDSLQDDLLELIKSSHNVFLLNMMALTSSEASPGFIAENTNVVASADEGISAVKAAAVPTGGKKMASAMTVSFQFRHQLDDLVATLRATRPHYIKCLKPNGHKSPEEYDPSLVMEQLRYSGILEVVRIRREGYPTRMQFRDFYNNYYLLGHAIGLPRPNACASCDNAEIRRLAGVVAALVLESEDPTLQGYQLGHNKMFLRDGCLRSMSSALLKFKRKYCLKIQAWLRCKHASQHYKLSRIGALLFQSAARRYLARKKLRERKSAWIIVNRHVSREFRRRQAVRVVAVYRAEEAAIRKAAAELAERLRLEEEARRIAEEASIRHEMSHRIQLWGSSRCRQRIARKRYVAALRAACLIENRVRIMMAKKKKLRLEKEKFADAVRVVMAFAHTGRSRMQQRRNRSLLETIVVDDGEGFMAHLKKYPSDENLVLRLAGASSFRSVIHTMAFFGSCEVLKNWQPNRSCLIQVDRCGRHSFHHWAMGPHPRLDFALELMSRCKSSIYATRASILPSTAVGSDSLYLKEGWLHKKRPGNKFEKRWATLEPTSSGIRLSYFKAKGDKTSKGEVDLQRTEEALTIRRVPIEETSGASDELFQFEIFSPIGLAHKSKSPIMYFNTASEAELQEWLAALKHGISARKPSSPTRELHGLRANSIIETESLGVSMKFRPQFSSELDFEGNTAIFLMCKHAANTGRIDSTIRMIFASRSRAPSASHFLNQSPWKRQINLCSTVLWLLPYACRKETSVLKFKNDKNQNLLHMGAISGNRVLCEVIAAVAIRELLCSQNHQDDEKRITEFIAGKDNFGCTPKSYADEKPLDVSDICISDASAELFDVGAAVARLSSQLVTSFPPPLRPFGGLSYLNLNILSFDIKATSEVVRNLSLSEGICSYPVRIRLRPVSRSGHWLTNMSSADISSSVLSVLYQTSADNEKTLRVCIGHLWQLSVPLQNFEPFSSVLIELTGASDDSPLGWSYLRIPVDFLELSGMEALHVFPGGCPVPLRGEVSSVATMPTLPEMPAGLSHELALQVEFTVEYFVSPILVNGGKHEFLEHTHFLMATGVSLSKEMHAEFQ